MSTLVLRAAPLLGALAGLVPHTVSRLRDPVDAPGEQDLGVGTARLVLVDGPGARTCWAWPWPGTGCGRARP